MKELDNKLDILLDLYLKGHKVMSGIDYLKLGDGSFRFDFEFLGHDDLTLTFTRPSSPHEYWFMTGSLEFFDNDDIVDFLDDALDYAHCHPPKPKFTGVDCLLKALNFPLCCKEAVKLWAVNQVGNLSRDIVITPYDHHVSILWDLQGVVCSLKDTKEELLSLMTFKVTDDAFNCFFNHTSYSYNDKDRLIGYMKQSLSRGYDTVTLVHSDGVYVFGLEDDLIYLVGDKKQHPSLFVSQYNKVIN